MNLQKKLLGWKSSTPDGEELIRFWQTCQKLPLGQQIFSRTLGAAIPYTSSIRPLVMALASGKSRIECHDHRAIRNHLGSFHAIALANLGEFATGLAVITAAGAGTRSILKSINVEFLKKARGTLSAEAQQAPIVVSEKTAVVVRAEIKDRKGDVVARVEATWQVGPVQL